MMLGIVIAVDWGSGGKAPTIDTGGSGANATTARPSRAGGTGNSESVARAAPPTKKATQRAATAQSGALITSYCMSSDGEQAGARRTRKKSPL